MTVYVVWMSGVCVWKETEAADTSVTSQLRQPVFLVLPWATQHPSALFNVLWLKEESRVAKTEEVVSEGCCLATISHTSNEGVGMKTDQIVAHGHAVIKKPLAYMGKSEPSSSCSYSHH